MVWPDISRKIWSYIIAKLGVFTDVDPSKLELSSTSLSLSDVEIEPSKLASSGLTITQCVVGRLSLELKYSGLQVNATNLHVEAQIDRVEYPDLAISTFLETTKANLAELGAPDGTEPAAVPGPPESQSGMVARLADMALAQINATVSNIDINIRVNEDTMVSIYIQEAIMTSKHRIEIESVTVTRTNIFDESSSDTMTSGDDKSDSDGIEEELDDPMARSVFFDALGSLELKKEPAPISNSPIEIALIDRLDFCFQLNPVGFSVEIDRARVDGLQTLDFLVLLLNEVIPNKANAKNDNVTLGTKKPSEVHGDTGVTLHNLEIYESLESIEAPIVLSKLNFEASRLSIAELNVPNIAHVAPFLTVDFSESVELSVDVPISALIPLETLSSVQRIGGHILSILKRIKPPEDATPAPLAIRLPEIRVQVGEELTIHIFPDSGSEKGLQIREITVIAANSQLAVHRIGIDFAGSLDVESIKLKLSCGFLDEMKRISTYLSLDSAFQKPNKPVAHHSSTQFGIRLPEYSFKIVNVDVDGYDGYFGGSGALACTISNSVSSLEGSVQCHHKDSRANVNFSAVSKDRLQSIESTVRVGQLSLDLKSPPVNFSAQGGESVTLPQELRGRNLPLVSVSFIFETDIELALSGFTTLTSIEHAKLSFDGSRGFVSISRVCLDLVDPSPNGDGVRIPILKVKDIGGTYHAAVKIVLGRVALKVCADSYNFLTDLSRRFVPAAEASKFQVEPQEIIDVFEDVAESQFVLSNLKLDKTEKISDEDSGELHIEEGYMGGQSEQLDNGVFNLSRLLEVSTLWGAVSKVHFEIKRGQWQLYDGYDFQQTRDRVKDAIGRVTKVASDLGDNEESDDESDSAVVGDFMYNSLLITAPPSQKVDLGSKIASELGSSASLDRSSEPKLIMTVRKLRVASRILSHQGAEEESRLSVTVRDVKVSDLIKSSQFNYLLSPMEPAGKQDVLTFSVDTVGPRAARELRVNLQMRAMRLSLDQDTVEFFNRFFQFSPDSEDAEGPREGGVVSEESSPSAFIQRFEFGGLPLVIDYMPKKVDYKSLRSGMAAELLNLFAVKGAKLALTPSVLHGVDGWDRILAELLELWMPDIRANQLAGLISGISPIRRALKVSKGVSNYTIVPIKRTQITKGAGVVVRRTLDELLRLGSSWLDSTDRALSGE